MAGDLLNLYIFINPFLVVKSDFLPFLLVYVFL